MQALRRFREATLLAMILGGVGLACGDSAPGPAPEPAPVPAPAKISIFPPPPDNPPTSNPWPSLPYWPGPVPVTVAVSDTSGNPASGVRVEFVTSSGGGTAVPAAALTNDSGSAATSWTLGSSIGLQTLEGRVTGLPPAVLERPVTLGDVLTGQYAGTMTLTKPGNFNDSRCNGPISMSIGKGQSLSGKIAPVVIVGSDFSHASGELVNGCVYATAVSNSRSVYVGCFTLDLDGLASGSGTVSCDWANCAGTWSVTRQ